MALYQFIVAAKEQAECVDMMEPGHEWCVEGEYGYFGSFATQNEAWAFAKAECDANNMANGKVVSEVVLNA